MSRKKASSRIRGKPSSRRSTTKSSKSAASRAVPWRSLAGPALGLVLAAVVVSVCAIAIGRIRDAAAAYHDETPLEIVITWPTSQPAGAGQAVDSQDSAGGLDESTWLPRADRDELLRLAVDAAGPVREPFSADPLMRIRQALGATGWFDTPPTVARTGPDTITVSGVWRVPIVWIASGRTAYLVDRFGQLLPQTRLVDELSRGDRFVLNAAWGPPRTDSGQTDPTTPWKGEDVKAAIDLVVLLSGQPYWDQVAAVDLDQFFDDPESPRLVIVTSTGGRIVWGGPPGVFNPGEVADAVKLARLAHFAQSPAYNHQIDAATAGYDLWSHEVELLPAADPDTP